MTTYGNIVLYIVVLNVCGHWAVYTCVRRCSLSWVSVSYRKVQNIICTRRLTVILITTTNCNGTEWAWKWFKYRIYRDFSTPPTFFCTPPDQSESVTPPWGVKSRTDAEAAPGISWILFAGATRANLQQQQHTHTVLSWPAASLLVTVPWHDTHPVARSACCRCYAYTHVHPQERRPHVSLGW